jgi:hypothetical protein
MLNGHPRLKAVLDCYWKGRLRPILYLWFAMILATMLFRGAIHIVQLVLCFELSTQQLALVPRMEQFIDWRLPIVLTAGVGLLVLCFFVAAKLATSPDERSRRLFALERSLDEVSSAATHIACGVLALWAADNQLVLSPATGVGFWLGSFLCYLYAQYLSTLQSTLKRKENEQDGHADCNCDG